MDLFTNMVIGGLAFALAYALSMLAIDRFENRKRTPPIVTAPLADSCLRRARPPQTKPQ